MSGQAPESPWRAAQAAGAVLVLAAFLYSLRAILSPFVLFWLLVALLLPFRGRPGHALVITVAAILTLLWVLDTTGFLLAPFVLALVLAYILDPAVDRIAARGVARSIAVVLLALPALGAMVVAALVVVPALGEEVARLIDRAPLIVKRVGDWLALMEERLLRLDLPIVDERSWIERLRRVEPESVIAFLETRKEAIARKAWAAVLGLGRGLGSALTVLGYVVLTPILTFYLLRDYDRLTVRLAELLPRERREVMVGFAREYDRLLSRYLRGQLTVALIIGTLTGLGLWMLRFPHAGLVGVVAAAFNVVPYLGLIASLVPAVLIALVSGNVLLSLGKVVLVFGLVQVLEGTVISPRIVGESVGLHPVWVILALSVGGFFFGFVGLLIAIPLAVLIKLLVIRGVKRYRESMLYRGGTGGSGGVAEARAE
ncbi:MAG: AI-2E family transporter [Gemmatimonadetes bacterium]|nr:AI-2E family transporter [Gemmatimonadota bacterium]